MYYVLFSHVRRVTSALSCLSTISRDAIFSSLPKNTLIKYTAENLRKFTEVILLKGVIRELNQQTKTKQLTMNFRNASRLFAAIMCSASAVSIEAKINAAATATATDIEISSKDIRILRSGDSKVVNFKEKFWLTEYQFDKRADDIKDIQKFQFKLQNDGNVVLYRYDDGGDKPIWASDTHCNNCDLTLWLQEDGSLSLRHTGSNILLWSTYTGGYGTYPYEFVMPDPGFPMVVDKYGRKIWSAD